MYDQVLKTLKECRYSVLSESEDLDRVYRLRYESYLSEDAIPEDDSGMMSDAYDESPNCVHVAVEMDGAYVASLRLHLISSQTPHSPTLEVFPEINTLLRAGKTMLDPTRFVVHPNARKLGLPLHLAALRIPFLAAVHYDVDIVLAAVRNEHFAFYRRYLGCDRYAAPRPYLGLTKPLGLMMTIMEESRDKVLKRYPFFGPIDSLPNSVIDFPNLADVFPSAGRPVFRVA